MAKDSYCNLLCRKVYTDEEAKLFADRIEEDYRVDWCALLAASAPSSAPLTAPPAPPGSSTTSLRPCGW